MTIGAAHYVTLLDHAAVQVAPQIDERLLAVAHALAIDHPALVSGQTLHSPGSVYATRIGLRYQVFTAEATDCQQCKLRGQCLKSESSERGRQVTRFKPRTKNPQNPSERMRCAIDSVKGRRLYSQRIGTVEPVFGKPPGPGRWYAVHFHRPGPGVLPLVPPQLERSTSQMRVLLRSLPKLVFVATLTVCQSRTTRPSAKSR